jgi:hypothetical protein
MASPELPTALERQPELAVALVAFKHSTHDALSRRSSLAPPFLTNVELRYSVILDALASLCVPAPKGHLIALTLQIDLQAKKIILTAAANRTVASTSTAVSDKDLVPKDHIKKIWQSLQSISEIYTEQRRKNHLQARAAAIAIYNHDRYMQ